MNRFHFVSSSGSLGAAAFFLYWAENMFQNSGVLLAGKGAAEQVPEELGKAVPAGILRVHVPRSQSVDLEAATLVERLRSVVVDVCNKQDATKVLGTGRCKKICEKTLNEALHYAP